MYSMHIHIYIVYVHVYIHVIYDHILLDRVIQQFSIHKLAWTHLQGEPLVTPSQP